MERPYHVRVLVLWRGQVLLVEHRDGRDGTTFWLPPGGGSEPGESAEAAAIREVKEETGLDVRVLRRVPVPAERGYLCFVAELVGPDAITPEIEPPFHGIHAIDAAWHSVTLESPLAAMEPEYWSELGEVIREELRRELSPSGPYREAARYYRARPPYSAKLRLRLAAIFGWSGAGELLQERVEKARRLTSRLEIKQVEEGAAAMAKDTRSSAIAPLWESLETFARTKIQQFIQSLLEEEVTELLCRGRSERRAAVDAPVGYRNGHGKERRLSMQGGTIRLRRPRVRGIEGRFESKILPLFARRTKELGELLPELYLHGLSLGDFELALRGLLGEGAPLSASSIARLRAVWEAELAEWRRRDLRDSELVYAWADGVYVKAGLEKDKACLLVIVGAMRDGRKELLAVTPGHRESTESWSEVLRDLKGRDLSAPVIMVGDGALGLWAALSNVWPGVRIGRCWNHKILNVLDKLPKRLERQATILLREMAYAEARGDAERFRGKFAARFAAFPEAVACLETDWEALTAFFDFPKAHWKHLRTSNVVESPFASLRLRTNAAKRFKVVTNATALIWKVLRVAESRWRRLDAPELLKDVYGGRRFVDGKPITRSTERKAA